MNSATICHKSKNVTNPNNNQKVIISYNPQRCKSSINDNTLSNILLSFTRLEQKLIN